MTFHQEAEGAAQQARRAAPFDTEGRLNMVGRTGRLHLVQEPEPLLREGEWIVVAILRPGRDLKAIDFDTLLTQLRL